MILLFRIDNRLIHGQVIASWAPRLGINLIVVADDDMAGDDFSAELARLAVPEDIELIITEVDGLAALIDETDSEDKAALVLFRELSEALRSVEKGVRIEKLNLGNIHYSQGKRQLSPAVALSETEEAIIIELDKRGIEVEIKSVPNDRPKKAIDLL